MGVCGSIGGSTTWKPGASVRASPAAEPAAGDKDVQIAASEKEMEGADELGAKEMRSTWLDV